MAFLINSGVSTTLLSFLKSSNNDNIEAAVISRKTGGWWRQIILNKGSKDGVKIGSTVTGPGGLLGRVNSTSLFTSSVTLITSPESKLGVWVDRIQTVSYTHLTLPTKA